MTEHHPVSRLNLRSAKHRTPHIEWAPTRNIGTGVSMILVGIAAMFANFAELAPTSGIILAVALILIAVLFFSTVRLDLFELIILSMPMSIYFAGSGETTNLSVSDPLIVFVLVAMLTKRHQRDQLGRGVRAHLGIVVISFTAIMLVGLLPVLLRTDTNPSTFLVDAIKLLVVLIYLIVVVVEASRRIAIANYRFLKVWTVGAAINALLGILGSMLYQRGVGSPFAMWYRATGTLNDPNAFATFMYASIGIGLLWAFYSKSRLVGFWLLPLCLGVYYSYSRGAYVVFVLVASYYLITGLNDRRTRIPTLFSVLALSIGIVLVGNTLLGTVLDGPRDLDFEEDARVSLWEGVFRVLDTNPWFGLGLGQYRYQNLLDTGGATVAHNTYLAVLADTGLVGGAFFLLIVASVLVKTIKIRPFTLMRAVHVALFGILGMALTLNLQNTRYWWATIGIAMVVSGGLKEASCATHSNPVLLHKGRIDG